MFRKLIWKIKKRRFCKLNGWFCPDCIYHDFIFEGAIFRGNKCRFPRKGADDNRDYERAAEQREYDMLYESTYNPEDGSM